MTGHHVPDGYIQYIVGANTAEAGTTGPQVRAASGGCVFTAGCTAPCGCKQLSLPWFPTSSVPGAREAGVQVSHESPRSARNLVCRETSITCAHAFASRGRGPVRTWGSIQPLQAGGGCCMQAAAKQQQKERDEQEQRQREALGLQEEVEYTATGQLLTHSKKDSIKKGPSKAESKGLIIDNNIMPGSDLEQAAQALQGLSSPNEAPHAEERQTAD